MLLTNNDRGATVEDILFFTLNKLSVQMIIFFGKKYKHLIRYKIIFV